jgi:hypothetical protein
MSLQAYLDNIEWTGPHRDASGTLKLEGKSMRKTAKRKS